MKWLRIKNDTLSALAWGHLLPQYSSRHLKHRRATLRKEKREGDAVRAHSKRREELGLTPWLSNARVGVLCTVLCLPEEMAMFFKDLKALAHLRNEDNVTYSYKTQKVSPFLWHSFLGYSLSFPPHSGVILGAFTLRPLPLL